MASVPPIPEPVTLDEAKLNLRVTSSDEDARIASLIVAARQFIEGETGLLLVPRSITETVSQLGQSIELAAWPIASIDAIRYPGADGNLVGLPDEAWRASLKRRPVKVIPAQFGWATDAVSCGTGRPTLPVEIDITGGYLRPSDVPETIKQAMHLMIAHFYANRSAVESGRSVAAVEIPFGVQSVIDRARLDLI